MAYLVEIIEFKKLGFYKGQQIALPAMGDDELDAATINKTAVAAAGLSAALSATTRVVEVRNRTGSQEIFVRVNKGSDVTNAAAADAKSVSLAVGSYIRFILPARVPASSYKIDIR